MLLAAATLPVALRPGWTPPVEGTPVPWLLLMLTVGLGPPFLVVSATAPLLQKWFSGTDLPSARDPYYLYSASNVGSILALLAYPFLIEPAWSLSRQSVTWSIGYAVFAAMTIACGVVAARRPAGRLKPAPTNDASPSIVSWRDRAHWLVLSHRSVQPPARAMALLVLDAFSSDGIPVHLLTSEAIELYLGRLAPDGVIAFHISNRHLTLRPVLAAVAEERGLSTLVQHDPVTVAAEGRYASEWLLMARSSEAFGSLAEDPRWIRPAVPAGTRVWTDDFSDVLAVLKTNWAED